MRNIEPIDTTPIAPAATYVWSQRRQTRTRRQRVVASSSVVTRACLTCPVGSRVPTPSNESTGSATVKFSGRPSTYDARGTHSSRGAQVVRLYRAQWSAYFSNLLLVKFQKFVRGGRLVRASNCHPEDGSVISSAAVLELQRKCLSVHFASGCRK